MVKRCQNDVPSTAAVFNSDFTESRNTILLQQKRLEEVHPEALSFVRQYQGVRGLGIGAKVRNGRITRELCYRVYVDKKLSAEKIREGQIIPRQIFGMPTDIIQDGSYSNYAGSGDDIQLDVKPYRPLRGGILIKNKHHENGTLRGAATLGCLAVLENNNEIVALTSLHAISDGRKNPQTETGYDVGQPFRKTCCCCCHKRVVGDVRRIDPNTDSAVVDLNEETADQLTSQDLQNTILGVGIITGISEAVCFDEVEKYGAASGHTFGVVIDLRYQGNKILISPGLEPFAIPGDSGAVVVHKPTKRVIGLLIGGLTDAPSLAVAHHIGPVMSALGIRIAGWSVGALGIPSATCGVVIPTFLTHVQNWLDKYDHTAIESLIRVNTVDFASDEERTTRINAVKNILENVLMNRAFGRAGHNVVDNDELPFHETPVTEQEINDNKRFHNLEHLAVYQENLYKSFFPDGTGGIDYVKLREAFELFANGNARTYPPPPGVFDTGPRPGYREPDGFQQLLFSEFAFLCLENANNSHKPVNSINGDAWLRIARITVASQELFIHVYRPGLQKVPPKVRPVREGEFHDFLSFIRTYDTYTPLNFNLNNASLGIEAQLGASSSIGQSSNERKARLRDKYLNLSFEELKYAMMENIQQMLLMP
jgi:hypothetical protein